MTATSWLCPRCKSVSAEARERCPTDGWRLIENWAGRSLAGRWQLERLIGVGGGGASVWQAASIASGRPAAVKIQPATDLKEIQRFERGARISGLLEHRHMTRVIEHGREGDDFFLVMELLEGETLQRRIARLRTMPAADVAHVADQVLEALDHAHQQRIVHRDIKPANVFVTPQPDDPLYVRVLDFGIAKWVEGGGQADESRAGRLDLGDADGPLAAEHPEVEVTQAQQILGTPEYMAPEQIIGAPADVRSDIYAMGVMMFRMLSGRLPFEAKSRFEMYHRHINDPPPPFPPELKVPPALDAVIRRALEKRITDRWRDAASMRRALRAAMGLTAPTQMPESEPTEAPSSALIPKTPQGPRRRAGLGLWLGVAAALAAGGAVAVVLLGGDGARAPSPAATSGAAVAGTGVELAAPRDPSKIETSPEVEPAPDPSKIEASPKVEPALDPSKIEASPKVEPPTAPVAVAAPEPTPVAAKARFALSSEPTGAEVWRGSEKLGTTPLTLELERTELPVEVELRRAGHRPKRQTLAATEADEQAIAVELPRARAGGRPTNQQTPPSDIHLER